jgi:hypothetical protein
MAAANEFIEPTLMYQDLEKVKFSETLRRNPEDYAAFVNDRVSEMTDEAFHRKRTAFQKAHIDLGRYMDLDHNANYYKARNADVERIQGAITQNNSRIANQLGSDKDNSKRQFEINEYFYYNKLETLFFLQLFFISMLVLAVVLYGQKTNLITTKMAGLLTVLLLLVVLITGVYRYIYTNRTRDKRLWHRRYFPDEEAVQGPPLKCNNGVVEFDINSIIPESVTRCGSEMAQNLERAFESQTSEMLAYQQGKGTDSTLRTACGGIVGGGDSICSLLKE